MPARTQVIRSLAIAALGLVVLPAAAPAFDLTGTWTSSFTCTSLFEGEKTTFKDTPTVSITQSGAEIGMRLDYVGGTTDFYAALANPDAKKPDEKGEIALLVCSTDGIVGNPADFDEIGRFSVSTKTGKVKASMKGQSIFSDEGVAFPEAGSCKWKLTRLTAANPGVSTDCPSMLTLRAAPARHGRRGR